MTREKKIPEQCKANDYIDGQSIFIYLFELNSKEHPQDDRWGLAREQVSPLYYVHLRQGRKKSVLPLTSGANDTPQQVMSIIRDAVVSRLCCLNQDCCISWREQLVSPVDHQSLDKSSQTQFLVTPLPLFKLQNPIFQLCQRPNEVQVKSVVLKTLLEDLI